MVVLEETNVGNLNVLMPFSLGALPLKFRSIGQHVGGFNHHLNGYFVVFWGLVPWSDFPSVHWGPRFHIQLHVEEQYHIKPPVYDGCFIFKT